MWSIEYIRQCERNARRAEGMEESYDEYEPPTWSVKHNLYIDCFNAVCRKYGITSRENSVLVLRNSPLAHTIRVEARVMYQRKSMEHLCN